MRLVELFSNFDYNLVLGSDKIEINGITDDTNNIHDGDVFFCINGYNFDGHNFIHDAVLKGADSVVVEKGFEKNLPTNLDCTIISVEDTRKALSIASINYFGRLYEKIKIIGITGTNGKTTTTFILREIFRNAGFKTGLIGTINNFINDIKIKSNRTTPGAIQLNSILNDMYNNGVEYCFMEVSSHALELDRVYGIEFDYGVFTNLTQDHLDFHKNFSSYFNAKFKLFDMSHKKIINSDDNYGKEIINRIDSNVITYGIDDLKSDFIAKHIVLQKNQTNFVICDKFGREYKFDYNLVGRFNIYNALPSIIIALNEGISVNVIRESLKSVFVSGRLENVSKKYNLDCDIYLDYAHTPDGVKSCLNTLKYIATGRIICVIGCGGDRDKEKRPLIGKIASELSDYVYLTSDNPRSEDPIEIIKDIESGIEKSNYEIIVNRFDAIKKSIKNRKANDIILIAGKGHEDYQILKDKVIHFDEKEIIENIFRESC